MNKKLIKELATLAALSLPLTLLGTLARFVNLTILPIFADEAIYIRWSQIMGNEPTLRFLPLSDGKQPLFMWILMFALKLAQDPLFVGRAVSVIAGASSMIAISLIAYTLFKSKKIALFSLTIYALSPFMFFFDRMALVDSLLSSLGLWVLFFSILTTKTKRIDTAMVTGILLGLASLTKSPALFIALLIPSTWILIDIKNKKQIIPTLTKLSLLLFITYSFGLVMYNIQRLGPNFHLLTARTKDYVYPLSHLISSPLDPLKPHFDRSLRYVWDIGPWPVYLLVSLALVLNYKKFKREYVLLLVWFFVPTIVQSSLAKVLTARYILYSVPALLILAGSAFGTKKQKYSLIAYLSFVVFAVVSINIDYKLITNPQAAPLPRTERSGYLEEWTSGTGIKEISIYLESEQNREPNKKIVVGTEGYFGTLPDALQMYLNHRPEITIIGIGLDISKTPQSLLESKKAGNKTYLVINNSRLKLEGKTTEDMGLKTIAVYEKSSRPNWTREYVVHGPVEKLYLFEVN